MEEVLRNRHKNTSKARAVACKVGSGSQELNASPCAFNKTTRRKWTADRIQWHAVTMTSIASYWNGRVNLNVCCIRATNQVAVVLTQHRKTVWNGQFIRLSDVSKLPILHHLHCLMRHGDGASRSTEHDVIFTQLGNRPSTMHTSTAYHIRYARKTLQVLKFYTSPCQGSRGAKHNPKQNGWNTLIMDDDKASRGGNRGGGLLFFYSV